jgi:hypothetical protein
MLKQKESQVSTLTEKEQNDIKNVLFRLQKQYEWMLNLPSDWKYSKDVITDLGIDPSNMFEKTLIKMLKNLGYESEISICDERGGSVCKTIKIW